MIMYSFRHIWLLSALSCAALVSHAQVDKDNNWKLLGPNDSSKTVHASKEPISIATKVDSGQKEGSVSIHQSVEIETLIKAYSEADKKMDGYRIQIFLGKPKEAQKVRAQFIVSQ